MSRNSPNKSNSGSPMSGVDSEYAEMQRVARRARERADVSPVGFGGYYQEDNDMGIFNPDLEFEPGSRMPTPASVGSQPRIGTPQGRSQQGSRQDRTPPQNATRQGSSEERGRQRTQSSRAGPSTRPGSQGGSNLRLNVPSPSMFENLPNRSRSGTGTPNTPNTAQPPVSPPFRSMQATGGQYHGPDIPQPTSLPVPPVERPVEPVKANQPRWHETSPQPTDNLGRRVDRNPRPEGISFEWTETDRNFNWDKCNKEQGYERRISLIARDQNITLKEALKLPSERRGQILANLRARGVIPPPRRPRPLGKPGKRAELSLEKDQNFDWDNCTRTEHDYRRQSILTRDQGISIREWNRWPADKREAAVRQAVAKKLLPSWMSPDSKGKGRVKGKGKETASSQPLSAFASSSQPSGANVIFGQGPTESRPYAPPLSGQTRTAAGLNDDLYSDDRPPRSGNTIPGFTRPAARSGSRPPPTEQSRGRSVTSRSGSRPPQTSQTRGRTPESQRLGAPGSSTGPTVPTNRSPPAKPTKEQVALAKKEEKAREADAKKEKKRKADEIKANEKEAKKRAEQAKKTSPKPLRQLKPKPGPPGGGKRK